MTNKLITYPRRLLICTICAIVGYAAPVEAADSNIEAAQEAPSGHAGRLPAQVRALLEQAKEGDPMSQFRLGIVYKEGKDVAKSRTEAIKWFKAAANNNNIVVKSMAVFQLKELGVAP